MEEKRITVEVNKPFVELLLKKLKAHQGLSNSSLNTRVIVNISKEELDYIIYTLDKIVN